MIIGLLGILKAGGAYLPLDPLIPTERLVFMLQDARASVILTQQHLAERFEAAPLVCLDSDWDAIAQQPDENLLSAATPEIWSFYLRLNRQPKGRCRASATPQLSTQYSGRLDLSVGSSFATVSTFAADQATLLSFQHCVQADVFT